MAFSKVIFNGETLMDDTGNTATSSNMLNGVLAQNSAGQDVTGAVVTASASDTAPLVNGTASAGTASTYSRGDHVHPIDTGRQAKITASGMLKGDGNGGVTAATAGTDYIASHQDISGKLNTNGDGSNVTVAFTTASSRTNIATGGTLATAFGRIAKYLGDLGSMAFKSSVAKTDLASGVQSSLDLADSALQSYTETDPTVPSWAKASSKPSYTASEVGAATSSHTHGNITNGGDITATAPTIASGDKIIINDESASKITNGPSFGTSTTTYLRNDGSWGTPSGAVTSVNTKTGAVSLSASDVGALPSSTTIPSKTSDLTNDSGFLTSYTETDPTVPSWAKASSKPTYTASEVGAVPTTRTVNGKALSSDITLSASDVSALPSSTTIPSMPADVGITYGSTDLTAGTSSLTTGTFYAYYE